MHQFIAKFFCVCLFSFYVANGQVGINTDSPRKDLEVRGSFKANEIILPTTIPQVGITERPRYLLLVQNTSNGQILELDTQSTNAGALAYLIKFQLRNVAGDWVQGFNTRISSTDYALVVLYGYFDRPLKDNGTLISLPGIGTRITGSTWFLYADYPSIETDGNGTWNVVCAVYPKSFVKIMPNQTVSNLDANGAGAATTSPLP